MWGMSNANHGLPADQIPGLPADSMRAQQLPIPPTSPPGPPPGQPPSPEPPVIQPPPDNDMPMPGDPPPPPVGDPPSEKPMRLAVKEIGGPKGPEPTRYGDWEQKGRATDF